MTTPLPLDTINTPAITFNVLICNCIVSYMCVRTIRACAYPMSLYVITTILKARI